MTIARHLQPAVEAAARTMIGNEALNISPLQDGLFLVKEDSSEGREKLSQKGVVAERVVIDSVVFLLCNS